MRRVLVTGATGYIGSNLVKALIKQDEVHVLVRENSKYGLLEECISKIKIHKYNGSIEVLDALVKEIKPDIVVHLASKFIVDHHMADVEDLISSNVIFGTQLLECCKNNNINFFINTGTYWQDYNGSAFNPVNLYAASKQAFEDIAKYYVETSAIRMITLRLTDTYGPYDPRRKVLNLVKEAAKNDETLEMSLGEQELGLVYIDDVAKAYLKAMREIVTLEEGKMKVYIVRPYTIYTLKEVVQIYEKHMKKKLKIQWGKRPYRNREVMKVETDLENILEEKEMLTLEQGIENMCEKEKQRASAGTYI